MRRYFATSTPRAFHISYPKIRTVTPSLHIGSRKTSFSMKHSFRMPRRMSIGPHMPRAARPSGFRGVHERRVR